MSIELDENQPKKRANAHQAALLTITRFVAALQAGSASNLTDLIHDKVSASTSHRGRLLGGDAIAGMFGPPVGSETVELWPSNLYVAGSMTEARASGYLACHIVEASRLSFGAVFVIDLKRASEDEVWRVTSAKVQLSWHEGNTRLRPEWRYPTHEKMWAEGDPMPVLVSELDAPWHLFPHNELRSGETRDVEDTYARYSWGIDQADFGLLAGCYTEDAAGTFRPMGPLSGRNSIIGVLKDFRRAWPWMQHYGDVLGSHIEGDRAAIIVGRHIPQTKGGPDLYGAYYPMRLKRHGDLWRITWTEYRPGWFSSHDIDIPNLLKVTFSGEGDWAE